MKSKSLHPEQLDAPSPALSAGAVGMTFVPRPRLSVLSAPVGSEMVLVDSESGMVHALDPVAAVVWQCFDGEASLEEIAVDLADGFDVPLAVVSEDVIGMVRAAGRLGLLEGVVEDGARLAEAPTGLPQGEQVSLPGWRGEPGTQTLLVNWNARCSFCIRTVPALAALEPRLRAAGVGIVLVDELTLEETSALLSEQDVRATVVTGAVVETDSSPAFQGLGTPLAYLMDEEGRVASELAFGADSVVALARTLAGVDPDDEADAEALGLPALLPVAGGVCGALPRATSGRSFERTGTYEVGSLRVGIRANSPWAEGIVAGALARYRLPDSTPAPDSFSVVLTEDSATGRRPLNLLVTGAATVARSRSPRRVMMTLAGHLSCLYDPEPGLHRLEAVGAVVDGQAVLLPKGPLTWNLARLQAPLAQMGVGIVDEPFAHLDLRSGELVVVGPRIHLHDEVLAGLPDTPPGAGEPLPVPAGRYPLKVWLMTSAATMSRAGAVSNALGMVVADAEQVGAMIGSFASLLEGIEVVEVGRNDPLSIVESLRNWVTSCLRS